MYVSIPKPIISCLTLVTPIFTGISYQESPEFFDWFNDYRKGACDNIVNVELLPLWRQQPGLLEKLGKYNQLLQIKKV